MCECEHVCVRLERTNTVTCEQLKDLEKRRMAGYCATHTAVL